MPLAPLCRYEVEERCELRFFAGDHDRHLVLRLHAYFVEVLYDFRLSVAGILHIQNLFLGAAARSESDYQYQEIDFCDVLERYHRGKKLLF